MGVCPLGILFRTETWISLSLFISGSSEDLSAPLLCTARYLYCYADDVLAMEQRISDASTPDVPLKFSLTCPVLFRVPCRCMSWARAQAVIWQRLLTCPLYPLRRCLDTVRREFARLCCGLMDSYMDRDLLEHLAGISEEVGLRERRKLRFEVYVWR